MVGAMLSAALGSVAGIYGDESPGLEWALLYAVALTAPLAVRRRFPEIVAVAGALAFFVAMTFHIPEMYVGNIVLFIGMYTVGAWVDDRRRAAAVRIAIIIGMFAWLLVTTFQSATAETDDGLSRAGLFSPFVAWMLMQFLVNAAFFGGAYYMGDRAYASALEREALRLRTLELEREREVTAAQAVALDRVRIARELHDVVAHHVSAMGVQAGAARAVMERDPDAARTTLLGIEGEARSALDELHHLLETLRTPAGDAPSASTVRAVGPRRTRRARSRERDADHPHRRRRAGGASRPRAGQRLPRDAGGPDERAAPRRTGVPPPTCGCATRRTTSSSRSRTRAGSTPSMRPGLGIVGMRERAAASGGTIEVGPRARGGFLVRMRVPLASRVTA